MNQGLYRQLAQIEDRHWWHVSRRDLIRDILDRLKIDKALPALDIGCGTGGNIGLLDRYCAKTIGLDFSNMALRLASGKWPDHTFLQADANHLERLFQPGTFGLVTLFHVLYHQWIREERDILRQVYQVLKPGGYVVLTEPALKSLMRRHDIQDMGKTRYRLSTVRTWLNDAGFEVVTATYFNMIGLLPALLIKGMEGLSRRRVSDEESVAELEPPSPIVNDCLLRVLALERLMIQKMGRLPAGVSLLCVGRKSGKIVNGIE